MTADKAIVTTRGREERSRDNGKGTSSSTSSSRSRSKSRSSKGGKHNSSRSKSKDRMRTKSRDRKAAARLNKIKNEGGIIDEPLLEEQGQECLLLEDFPVPKNMTANANAASDNGDDNNKAMNAGDKAPATKKSSRKVNQVLLVPTNGELLMERYRMAGQRAGKARALLDQALNWDVSVTNRDRMASDAFLEAGKARLLVEPEKTPELIAMLADAKAKGEEEACQAVDYKVPKLIPDVNLPDKVGGQAVAAPGASMSMEQDNHQRNKAMMVKHLAADYDGVSTNMNNKHHMQCFQNMFDPHVTTRSEDYDNDLYCSESSMDDDEAAEEHVYRAKQYLEFILPDLGDVADDSSMAPKAVNNPRNILQAYQQQLGLNASGDTQNLQNMSSLGFDESHSYDIVSSEDSDEDTFSMSSLNEIMDAPIEDFQPDRILSVPSQLRHKLTVRMSFGGRSIRRKKSNKKEQADKAIGPENKAKTSEESAAPPSVAAVAEDVSVLETIPEDKKTPTSAMSKEKKRNPRIFSKRGRSSLALPTVPEEHGGFLSRFRSMKRKGNHRAPLVEEQEEDKAITDRIITPVLSDLSDAQSKQSSIKRASSRIIAPVLSELTDIASVPPRRDDRSLQTEDTITPEDMDENEDNESHNESPKEQRAKESAPRNHEPYKSNVMLATDDVADAEDKLSQAGSSDAEGRVLQDLALVPTTSIASSGDMLDDRYTIAGSMDDDEDDILPVEERYAVKDEHFLPQTVTDSISALSPASIGADTAHGRYSPFPMKEKSQHMPDDDILDNVLDNNIDLKRNDEASEEDIELGDDERSEKENSSHSKGTDAKNDNKRKRRSLMGLFRKEHDEDTKEEMTQNRSKTEPAATSTPTKSLKKPSSSLQKSLQEVKENPSKAQTQHKPNQKSLSAQSSSKQKAKKKKNRVHVQQDKVQSNKKGPQQKASQKKKIGVARKHYYSKEENLSSLKRALKESPQTGPSQENPASSQNDTKPQSSLKTALQLSEDTVEVMAMDSLVGAESSAASLKNAAAHKSAAGSNRHQKTTKKQPRHPSAASSPDKKPRSSKHGAHSKQRHSENKTHKPGVSNKRNQTPSSSEKGKTAHSWINNLGFHKKKKVGTTTPPKSTHVSSSKKTSTSTDKEPMTDTRALIHQQPVATNPVAHDLPKEGTNKKLQSDTVPTMKSSSDISVATIQNQNPLLPFQLLKQLEDQSSTDTTVKDAAERSIVASHQKYMSPSHRQTNGEKENDVKSTTSLGFGSTWSTHDKSYHTNPVTAPKMNQRQSPRVLGTNNTGLAGKTNSADPDGLNARAKDVREIYGLLPAAEDFVGEDRSRSFLTRITHGAYRQGQDLPDP